MQIPKWRKQCLLRVPNAETVAAIKEARDHPEPLLRYETFADLVADLDREIASENS